MGTSQSLFPVVSGDVSWTEPDGYLQLDVSQWDVDDWAPSPYDTQTQAAGTVLSVEISRGRDSQLSAMPAGTAVVTLERTFGGTVAIVGGAITINAKNLTATSKPVFTGVVQTMSQIWDPATGRDWTRLTCADGMRALANISVPSQDPASSFGDTSTERISGLLDSFGFAGTYNVPSTPNVGVLADFRGGANLLQLINQAVAADAGMFFCDKAGVYQYLAGGTLYDATRYTGTPALEVFSTSGSATKQALGAINTSKSADRVANIVRLTIADGRQFAAEDGDSRTLYGPRTLDLSTINNDATEARITAQRYAASYAGQIDTFAPITVHAARGTYAQDLQDLELGDWIEVTGAGTGTVDCIVEGMRHAWDAQRGWTTTMHTNRGIPAAAT